MIKFLPTFLLFCGLGMAVVSRGETQQQAWLPRQEQFPQQQNQQQYSPQQQQQYPPQQQQFPQQQQQKYPPQQLQQPPQKNQEFVAGGFGPEYPVTLENDQAIVIVRQLSDQIVSRIQQKGERVERIAVLSKRVLGSLGPNYTHYLIKIQVSDRPQAYWLLVYETRGQPYELKGVEGPRPLEQPLESFQ